MRKENQHKILISEEQLRNRVTEIGTQISHDYQGKHPVIISVLRGGFYFVADLTRQLTIPAHIDFLAIGVYPGATSKTGVVRITKDLEVDISGRHVIMVEDIVRTGLTLGYLYQHLESHKPASLNICTLLDNPDERLVNIPIKYRGYTIGDEFVIGYGMDYKEDYRHLPYIAEIIDVKR